MSSLKTSYHHTFTPDAFGSFGILSVLEPMLTRHAPNMLRLQPSEIVITPEDIRTVNQRLDARKKAKARVKLHPGPERSRDDAVITRLQQLNVSSRRAEVSTDEDGSEEQTTSSHARTRIGLGPPPSQVQPRPAPMSSRGLPHPASMSTLQPQASFTASNDRPIMPIHLEPSESSSASATSTIMPLQAQFDGQVDAFLSRDTSSTYGTLRNASNSSLLLQSRTLSAPMIPQVTVQAPTPRAHVRQPFSDGAIAFDSDRRGERSYRLLRATTVDPGPSTVSRLGAGSIHAVTQSVMRMSFNSPPRLGATSPSPPPDPQNVPAEQPHPAPPHPLLRIVGWNPDNRRLRAPPASPTFSEAIRVPTGRQRPSSESSDSSAVEAATTGRLSPLESISQQAAIVHGRLASRERRRRSSDLGPRRPALDYRHVVDFFQGRIPTSFQRPGAPGEPFDIQLQGGRMIRWRDRRRDGYTHWHPDLLTSIELVPLEITPSLPRFLGPQAYQGLLNRSREEMFRLDGREALRPDEGLERVQHARPESSRAAVLHPGPARFPIPERHSSRDDIIRSLIATLMLNWAQDFTRQWLLGYGLQHSHAFDQLARLRHLTGELPTASPRRNGAEIQRTTALPVAIRQRPEASTITPPRQSQHLHVPRAAARARQRNQENSEEASMEQFRDDIAALRERERRAQNESAENGVLDDTPPRILGVERHLNAP